MKKILSIYLINPKESNFHTLIKEGIHETKY